MRKTVPMSNARNYVGKAAKPVFIGARPTFRTRPDWRAVWLNVAIVAVVTGLAFGIVYAVLSSRTVTVDLAATSFSPAATVTLDLGAMREDLKTWCEDYPRSPLCPGNHW